VGPQEITNEWGVLLSISLPLSIKRIPMGKVQEKQSKQEERLGTLADPQLYAIHSNGVFNKKPKIISLRLSGNKNK
jgi:hypothetical protein